MLVMRQRLLHPSKYTSVLVPRLTHPFTPPPYHLPSLADILYILGPKRSLLIRPSPPPTQVVKLL